MLPEILQGTWDQDRLVELFTGGPEVRGDRTLEERREIRREICNILNRLQNRPVERIVEVKVLRKPEIVVKFADESEVVLESEKLAANFLTEYIRNREEYIGILEYNRAGDPRVTKEYTRLQRQLERATSYLTTLGKMDEVQDIKEMK